MDDYLCPDCDTPLRLEQADGNLAQRFRHPDYYWCPECGYQAEAEVPGEEERVRY